MMLIKILAWIVLIAVGGGLLLGLVAAIYEYREDALAVVAAAMLTILLMWAIAELFY
jgi:hypothetical protein